MTVSSARAMGTGTHLPGEAAVLPRARGENFAVASLLLGRQASSRLMAIYGFARLVDTIGDDLPGDRTAALDLLERELESVYSGEPQHPLMRRLVPAVRACDLPRGPFLRLIEANRRDQVQHDYRSFDDLVGYCDLSANPVGELVLHVFGVATPDRIALSDRVCTALQLIEHWQDVAEDAAHGRIYLPAEDMEEFRVTVADLSAERTGTPLRCLLAFEVERARQLLGEGATLLGLLEGRARLAVSGYIGGGRAALAALVAAEYDVLRGPPRAGKLARLRSVLRTYGARA
ncbi:MAG: squalene synthase HpnC [Gaiellaceae bacterium]